MFPGSGSGLSLIKVLGGISKTLSIAREIIPIYEQAKPMVQNARKAFSVLKEISPSKPSFKPLPQTNNSIEQKKTTTTRNSSPVNNPSFFR